MKKVLRHRLFWPIAALLTLILINTIVRPQFIVVTVRDGQLYGVLIDILRTSAPLMLVALGMTMVIATRGIDLSVGAIMAVSGAVALTIIDASSDPGSVGTVMLALVVALGVSLILGAWNGLLVSVAGIQPIIATLVLMLAGRGVALLITDGFITTVNSAPYSFIATGYLVFLPVAFLIALGAIIVVALAERRTASARAASSSARIWRAACSRGSPGSSTARTSAPRTRMPRACSSSCTRSSRSCSAAPRSWAESSRSRARSSAC